MRLLFLILLLLNLLYFGWQQFQLTGDVESFSASDPGLEKLVLLYEAEEQEVEKQIDAVEKPVHKQDQGLGAMLASEQTNKIAKDAEQALNEDQYSCYEIGPFNKKEDAQQLFELMKPNVKQVKLDVKSKMLTKYWVFLPSQESLQAARKTVNQLASKGIKDYQILTISGKKNAISLGLYKDRKFAELQFRNIKNIGYSPEIRVIEKKVPQYWLETVTDQTDKARQARISELPEGITKKIPCL